MKNEIISLIENENVDTFYCGGKGDFDRLCAECVNGLKNNYPFIKTYMVFLYIPGKKCESGIDLYKDFNGTIYPEGLEFVPQKLAIIKRNEWLINKSSFLIAHIDHEWGGAYKTFKYAKRREHIKVINRLPAKSRKSIPLSFSTSYFLPYLIFDFAGSLILQISIIF